jgi:hypothetical protein
MKLDFEIITLKIAQTGFAGLGNIVVKYVNMIEIALGCIVFN